MVRNVTKILIFGTHAYHIMSIMSIIHIYEYHEYHAYHAFCIGKHLILL